LKTVLICCISLILCPLGYSIDLPDPLIVNGKQYRGVIYSAHDAVSLSIFHETGAASIPIKDLPNALQETLGYSPKLAAEQIKAQHEAKVAVQQPAHKKEVIYCRLVKNTARGWIVETKMATGEKRKVTRWQNQKYETYEEEVYETILYLVYGHPNAVHYKPGIEFTWEVISKEVIHHEGLPMILSQYSRTL
jgi:hypothetical protein